jgi:tetratricopeptide (TPR) repeat protein
VFWVDTSSLESVNMSLKGISSIPAAQASCLDGSAESTLQWISGIQEEWLIVFDNADDLSPDVVAKFVPPGNRGNILITSRNRSMGRLIAFENVIEINEMEEADAITLLLKASCLDVSADHLQAAKDIVTTLGCMPLAVDQAGAYIEAGKCDINNYLRQFSSHRQTLMMDATYKGASDYDRTVYGTWDLSFHEIEKRASGQSGAGNAQAAKAAILILGICAFYHHSNISEDIFQSAAEESGKYVVDSKRAKKLPHAVNSLDRTLLALNKDGHWDELIYKQGMSVLLSFSLIKRDQTLKMLSVHPLIHCWSREHMSKTDQQRMYEIGTIILSCAISRRLTRYDYGLRQLIFSHIKANELHGSEMNLTKQYYDDKCNNFKFVMEEIGDWNNAEQLGIQVLSMRKKLLGAKHPDTITSMGNLARIYCLQGKLNEAEQLEVQVLDVRKKMLGAEHPDTLTSMGSLASIYYYQGKLNEAKQLEIQVMEIRKKVLGAEHPDTITNMASLARTYHQQGNLNEAEELEVQVLSMRKKLLGAEHPDTLISMGNLAWTYCRRGKLNKAEQLGVQVLDMRKKLLGAKHPDTLTCMGNLASIYCYLGKLNEAEQLEVQVLDMRKKVLGAEHPDTHTSMGNLGRIYCHQGKLNEAEQLEIQVLEMRKKLLGVECPDTLTCMGNLAVTYSCQGKLNEAEQLEVQVLSMRKKLLGAKHPDTVTSMGNLARTYCNQGKLNEAEQLEVQVLEIRKKLLGAEHPDTLTSMGNLARTYSSQGKWDEAEQLKVQVLDMKKKLLGAENPDTLI